MRSSRPAARSIAPPPPPNGELIAGKYRVESLIGEGGRGTVLAARHEVLDLSVALKLLSPTFARDPAMVERFAREARRAAILKSEHVARITDVGTLENGQPYIATELLRGEDLEQRGKRLGRLPVPQAVDFVLQALEAMAHAHAAGIVHRDLKPSNLFLALRPDGREVIKVLDFASGQLVGVGAGDGDASSPAGDRVLGSPGCMAPEQIGSASKIDHRADIWAIGVILYDLLTEQLPFPGGTAGEMLDNILTGSAPPLQALRPEAPAELETALDRCLQRDPEKRFASVHELASALAPHGSGAWTGYVERIAQILTRGAAPQILEDTVVRRISPKDVERASLQETTAARAIESVRVPPLREGGPSSSPRQARSSPGLRRSPCFARGHGRSASLRSPDPLPQARRSLPSRPPLRRRRRRRRRPQRRRCPRRRRPGPPPRRSRGLLAPSRRPGARRRRPGDPPSGPSSPGRPTDARVVPGGGRQRPAMLTKASARRFMRPAARAVAPAMGSPGRTSSRTSK